MPFHFFNSLTVQWFLAAIELNVSPFFTTWVLGLDEPDEADLLELFPELFPACAIGDPEV